MHLPSRILALSATVLSLINLSTAVSPSRLQCVRSASHHAGCGDGVLLRECLDSLSAYLLEADVEMCFLDAGCGPDEASASAIALLASCASDDELEMEPADLRKRQRTGSNDDEDVTDEEDTSNNSGSNDSNDEADQEEDVADTPTRNQPAATAAPTPNATPTVQAQQPTQQSPNPTPVNAAAQTTASESKECITTTTIRTTICKLDDKNKNFCEATDLPKPTCREGYLCRMDASGITVCMEKQNSLSTGGVIVAIVFASAIVVSVGLMTWFCCKEKRDEKKLKAKLEAAAIAKASGAGKKARNVSDTQPLMAQAPEGYGGPRGGGQGPQDPFQDPNGNRF